MFHSAILYLQQYSYSMKQVDIVYCVRCTATLSVEISELDTTVRKSAKPLNKMLNFLFALRNIVSSRIVHAIERFAAE